ncbi:phage tail assembly protein T [Limnoglobus roseus]|uniref:Minor tail T domain-containing protein n=1 Tax=Limnoglobus roseus TaxID=2598579 RepID=A0A5C1A7Q1_9BACT|nr:hypothetical protein [Limnoglobus roseus]QEL13872.1 hypothetical protein PX52LOC_00730 [Limnoglobus roseus]
MTLFRLSREQGVSVFTLADDLTADQVGWYSAYHQLEPFTFVADDVRCAIQAHTTAATQCKNPPSFGRFVPKWEGEEPLTGEAAASALSAWASDMNKAAGKDR